MLFQTRDLIVRSHLPTGHLWESRRIFEGVLDLFLALPPPMSFLARWWRRMRILH